jgi:superfamily II DNA/RNA helicase
LNPCYPPLPYFPRFQELGFSTPTDIQKEALPKALAGKDIIIQAKTGSGKTLAFVLPLLEKLAKLSAGPGETCALCIAPTRELAVQIQEVILQLDPTLSPFW